MTGQALLDTDWNGIKNLDDFFRQWPSFSADFGVRSLADISRKPSCDSRISDLDDITGLVGYYELSGQYVSQLESAYRLFRNDLFLVSQCRQTTAGSDECSNTSRKISYRSLSTRLFYDILNGLSLGSMAYREKYEYAVSSHGHDKIYSRVNMHVNPMYDRESPQYAGDDNVMDVCSCWISTDYLTCDSGVYSSVSCNPGHTGRDVRMFVWKAPKVKLPIPPRPMIGTIRFVGAATLGRLIEQNGLTLMDGAIQVNPYDSNGKIRPDYDGWVFPNGAEMENRDMALSAASMVYFGSRSSNFIVPEFSQFFRINAGESHVMETRAAQVGLKKHMHQIGRHTFDGTINLNHELTKLYSKAGGGPGGYGVHHGRTYDPPHADGIYKIISVDMTLNLATSQFTELRTTACAA